MLDFLHSNQTVNLNNNYLRESKEKSKLSFFTLLEIETNIVRNVKYEINSNEH